MTTPFNDPSQGDQQQPNQSFRSQFQQMKQDPRIQQAAQDVSDAHPQGEFARTPRVMAGGIAAGYRLGKDPANADMFGGSQPAPSDGGWGSQGGVSNGNGGDNEFATRGDLNEATQGLHDKIDGLAAGGQASGPDGGPGRNNAFSQGTGRTPAPQAAGTQQPGVPSPLTADYAAQRLNMQAYQQNVHDSIEGGRASLRQRAANWAAATPGGVQQTGTGNGMSSGMQQNSMAGALPGSPMRPNSGIGQSESSFNSTRFMGGQQ
jgi:hypothetical protein